ncbi:PH domain-containing protein [Cohnella herbarum]|uniref:PH domain-containing protein n=1 Tax=Cohnella herbarum TaxID=2728023 RepID=A0A7Z2ZPA4_9BACL|nr:PH domain-containing protein [Cohnella herbarum]QJD87246.1 PH domain-containing protein [Cohnella herbarum]
MSEPVVRRQHPLYFLVIIAEWLKPLLVPIVVFVVINRRGNPDEWPPIVFYGIVAAFVVQFVAGYLSWRRFTYVRDDRQLLVRSGVLFRQVKAIHRNRVHSIQIQQPFIQRMLGISQVVVETAGGGGKPEVVIRAVSLEEAEAIQALARRDLEEIPVVEEDQSSASESIARTASRPIAMLAADETAPTSIQSIHVSSKTLTLAALTTTNIQLTLAFIAGIASFADDILGKSVYESLADTAMKSLNGPFAIVIWSGVALLLAWVLSIGLYVWKYAGFKLERNGDRITVSHGLLEKRQLTFSVAKVQAVLFVEGLLRKPLGRGEVRLLVVQSDKETSVMLHPYLKADELEGLLASLMPDVKPIAPTIVPEGKAWLAFVRWKAIVTGVAAAGLIYGFGFALAWPALLLLPLVAWWGYAQFRSEAAGTDGSHFVLRHRRLAVTTAWMRRKHIQALTMHASVIQRRKGRRDVRAAVMGGLKGTVLTARMLPVEDTERIGKWFSRRS